MNHTFSLVGMFFFAIIFIFFSLDFPAYAETATTGCEDLHKLATSMGRKVDPLFINKEVCDAYTFLLTKYQPGPQSAVEGKDGILRLNTDFAVRLSNYIRAYPQLCIISAFRSVETQTKLWNAALRKYGSAEIARKWVAPPGSSMHNKGAAADLGCGINQQIRDRADEYKLVFRLAHEGWHVEPKGAVRGGLPEGTNTSAPPSAGITNALRGFFNPSGQQSAPSSAPGYTIPSSVSPQQAISVTAGTEPAQVSPGGTTAGPQFVGGVSSQLGATGTTTRASSTADRLEELAFGVRATTTQSQIYIPLVVTGSQAVGVSGNVQNQGMQPLAVAQLSPSLGQNTFISADLSWQTGGFGYTAPVTGWQVTLMNITNVLRRILALLQPFGARSLGLYEEGVE